MNEFDGMDWSVLGMPGVNRRHRDIASYFLRRCEWVSKTGCIEWTGARQKGYGQATFNGRTVRASRLVLHLKLGRPIAGGMLACHHCDNPSCVNPSHIYEGTCKDNGEDAARRERMPHGSGHYNSVFSEADVVRMREMVAAGGTLEAVATEFGCAVGQVSEIARGSSWRLAGGPITKHRRWGKLKPDGTRFGMEDARRIRADPRDPDVVAAEYGMSPQHIRTIRRGEVWREDYAA